MTNVWGQSIPAEVKAWAALALLVLFFAAVGFYAAFTRWMKHRYGPASPPKRHADDAPDAWAESARRMRHDPDDMNEDEP